MQRVERHSFGGVFQQGAEVGQAGAVGFADHEDGARAGQLGPVGVIHGDGGVGCGCDLKVGRGWRTAGNVGNQNQAGAFRKDYRKLGGERGGGDGYDPAGGEAAVGRLCAGVG